MAVTGRQHVHGSTGSAHAAVLLLAVPCKVLAVSCRVFAVPCKVHVAQTERLRAMGLFPGLTCCSSLQVTRMFGDISLYMPVSNSRGASTTWRPGAAGDTQNTGTTARLSLTQASMQTKNQARAADQMEAVRAACGQATTSDRTRGWTANKPQTAVLARPET